MTQLTDPDRQQIRQTFERDGIVILPALLPADAIGAVDAHLNALLADKDKGFGNPTYGRTFDTWVKVWPTQHVSACERLWQDSQVLAATQAVLGEDYESEGEGAFCTPPGCGQAWHQDSWSDEPGQFVVNRIVFTRDYAAEHGELVYVPGSHRAGNLPPGGLYEPIDGEQRVAPSAGTLVLMSSRCYHQVSKNRSDAPRIQVNSRVRPAGAAAGLCKYAIFRTGRWDFQRGCVW